MMSQSVPKTIGDLPVVSWSPIDERHRVTGACRHFDGLTGIDDPTPSFVAIVGQPENYFLMRFTKAWEFITDTWHRSLDEARHQAEFEYAGVSATWSEVEG